MQRDEVVDALHDMYHCFKDYEANPHDIETLALAEAVLAKVRAKGG